MTRTAHMLSRMRLIVFVFFVGLQVIVPIPFNGKARGSRLADGREVGFESSIVLDELVGISRQWLGGCERETKSSDVSDRGDGAHFRPTSCYAAERGLWRAFKTIGFPRRILPTS